MWNDPETTLSMLEHQLRALLAADGARQLRMLPKFMGFLEREPLLGSALRDLQAEAERALAAYIQTCVACREQLKRIWTTHGPPITTELANCSDAHIDAYERLAGFDKAISTASQVEMPELPLGDELSDEPTRRQIKSVIHWIECTQPGAAKTRRRSWRSPLLGELRILLRQEETAFRALKLDADGLGGFAAERLRGIVQRIHPAAEDVVRHAAYEDLRAAVLSSSTGLGAGMAGQTLKSACEVVVRDASVLVDELRLRILLGLSRHGVLQRYAARCETFRAAHLRTVAQRRSHERQLTLDLAEYLFEAGFTPLIDPQIAGLKPDIIDAAGSSLFYVEAKQYNDARAARELPYAYHQVWSTWLRLEKQHRLYEGFLVVFRRNGPLVHLPTQLDLGHRRLHSMFIDIADNASTGSNERMPPITLHPSELLPTIGKAPRRRGARTV